MDKNSIKKYAVWARNELIARVTQKANQYGITEAESISASADSIHGKLLTPTEKKQRAALIEKIKNKGKNGFQLVMEEVAYTWFNRFTAIRFMEVNGYLPSHIRVFTDDENRFAPQILAEAIHLDMPGLDMDKVFELKQANKTEELYKFLIITQCNALNEILPDMFQRIEDYTELLLPDNLLREGSVIEQMISLIPEEDWTDQVQIIGWLYQFYNIEPKAAVFAKNGKVAKEEIPAATQLFTPDWIVRYMVENSLGRLWVEGHPNDDLKSTWKYYLDEAEQEDSVQAKLETIRKEYAGIKPEEIKVIDPCMGSGHILCYMFDVLVQIYESYGYTARDAAASIVENNIFGLDIDDRASQLAYFAVMMKARQYDRRFFSREIKPNVYAIVESNGISRDTIEYFINGDEILAKELNILLQEMKDAKEYGSIIKVSKIDFDLLYSRFAEIQEDTNLFRQVALDELLPLVLVAHALSQKYHIAITNPPYMAVSGMSAKVIDYTNVIYPDSKTDLFSVFIERCNDMLTLNGFQGMITMHSWMFLSSYERLRHKLQDINLINMCHLGARAFEEIAGEVVQTVSWVMRRNHVENYISTFCRLTNGTSQNEKEKMFYQKDFRYQASQSRFSLIPGLPYAYWASEALLACYSSEPISKYGHPCKGIDTGNNDLFLRLWHEVDSGKRFCPNGYRVSDQSFSTCKWFPYNKGGSYRKWYGNNEYVVNWADNGHELRSFKGSNLRNRDRYFDKGITWSTVSAGNASFRFFTYGFLFDNGGTCLYSNDNLYYIHGLLNSVVAKHLLTLQPTLNTQPGTIGSLPYIPCEIRNVIDSIVQSNIELSRSDWDAFETSWDFTRHPLIARHGGKIYRSWNHDNVVVDSPDSIDKWDYLLSTSFESWKNECEHRFAQLKTNEEELNRIFIDIYGLQNELTTDVDDKEVTVRKADLTRDVKSLISYAVGCMFGRYSLDVSGLAYAGGEWDESKYTTFKADKDSIIPICDDEYFSDDIVGRFVRFIEVAFGKATLDENLRFIADALGGSGQPKDVIRKYFMDEFYADHLKNYQKRPIYWQFDSGKKNGFKCLIYMHRYQPDTIARIRTDYVHEQQARYRTAIADLEQRIQVASTSERVKLTKQLQKLKDQETEIRLFEEKVHHLADQMIRIDLDDGVKHNYEIFKGVLTKLK